LLWEKEARDGSDPRYDEEEAVFGDYDHPEGDDSHDQPGTPQGPLPIAPTPPILPDPPGQDSAGAEPLARVDADHEHHDIGDTLDDGSDVEGDLDDDDDDLDDFLDDDDDHLEDILDEDDGHEYSGPPSEVSPIRLHGSHSSEPEDVTDSIPLERLPSLEDHFGIYFDGLAVTFQAHPYYNQTSDVITLRGDLRSMMPDGLEQSIALVFSAHDERGRVLTSWSEHCDADAFLELATFTMRLDVYSRPARLRLYPKAG
jgi:hypothetical protein